MSLPPQILRIKRKAEDSPVDALYIEEPTKRRVTSTHGFVFRRLIPKICKPDGISSPSNASFPHSATSGLIPSGVKNNGIPQVMATRPGDENTLFDRDFVHKLNHEQRALPSITQTARRFHLSNAADLSAASLSVKESTLSIPRSGVRRVDETVGPVALFVEDHTSKEVLPASTTHEWGMFTQAEISNAAGIQFGQREFTTPLRKRPGATAAVEKLTNAAPQRSISSVENGTSGLELRDALQKYAMEEFADTSYHNGTNIEHDPQYFSQTGPDEMEGIEYIYDTYVRQPTDDTLSTTKASASMDTYAGSLVSGPTNSIGYLIIPESSSSVFFFNPDSDDEDEKKAGDWDSEEDDENNENYYTADYPEEEDRDDDGEVWSNDECDDADYQGEDWKWEMKKKEWGWENGRVEKCKTVHGEDEIEDEDDEDE